MIVHWSIVAGLAATIATGCQRDIKLLPLPSGGKTVPVRGQTMVRGKETAGPRAPAWVTRFVSPPRRAPPARARLRPAATVSRCVPAIKCQLRRGSGRDAFDSRDATISDDTSASIGLNGGLLSTAEVRAGGALHVAGAVGIRALDHVEAATSLRVGGPLAMLTSNADVGTDAFVAGDLSGSVRVDGTLHVPAGATLGPDVQAAAIVREAVTVDPPCDCGASFVDIAAALQAASAANDNASAPLRPDQLASVTSPVRIELPCGTFHLAGIDAQASVTLAVHGRALLAVTGDVVLRGEFRVELDPGAELDLLIGGRLSASGGNAFGAAAAPARFRVWIAGTDSVVFDDQPAVSAVLRAPAAIVTAPAGLWLYGSLLARSFVPGA